jgi:hypothetical protein
MNLEFIYLQLINELYTCNNSLPCRTSETGCTLHYVNDGD